MSDVDATAEAATSAPRPDERPLPPVRNRPGLKPAMIVVGIAALILVVFAVGSGLSSGHHGPSQPSSPQPVAGSSLLAVPAAPDLHAIVQPGSPPANIVQAVTVPRGTTVRGSSNRAAGSTQFDAQVALQSTANEAELITFYRSELRAERWQLVSQGPPTRQPGYQLLAKKAGNDGWYWEIGVIISPTRFGTSASGSGGATPFAIRLLQLPDAD